MGWLTRFMVWQLAALLLVRKCGDPCWLAQPWMLRHYHAALQELAAGPYLLLILSDWMALTLSRPMQGRGGAAQRISRSCTRSSREQGIGATLGRSAAAALVHAAAALQHTAGRERDLDGSFRFPVPMHRPAAPPVAAMGGCLLGR